MIKKMKLIYLTMFFLVYISNQSVNSVTDGNFKNDESEKIQRPQAKEENNENQQKPKKVSSSLIRELPITLYYSRECQDDITRYCPKAKSTILTDMAVLQCIHNEVPDLNLIDKPCHNVILLLSNHVP